MDNFGGSTPSEAYRYIYGNLHGLIMATTITTTKPENDRRFPSGIYKGTREEWLEEAMHIMAPWLNEVIYQPRLNNLRTKPVVGSKSIAVDRSLREWTEKDGVKKTVRPSTYKFRPSECRVSCSLLSAGMSHGPAIAHVHLKHATGNNYHEIRMGAHLGGRKTKESSSRVADILLHEMIHTMFPHDGHKMGFRWTAHAIGLNAPMTSTSASPALKERIDKEVVNVLGRYPHKGVKLVPRGKRGKGSRLVKFQCLDEECGCIIRLTRKWIDRAEDNIGMVSCPVCQEEMGQE